MALRSRPGQHPEDHPEGHAAQREGLQGGAVFNGEDGEPAPIEAEGAEPSQFWR